MLLFYTPLEEELARDVKILFKVKEKRDFILEPQSLPSAAGSVLPLAI